MDRPYFYIDPDTCIDCGACVPVCPPEAIFPEDEVPEEYAEDIEVNARFFSEEQGYWDFDLEQERVPLAHRRPACESQTPTQCPSRT